MNRSLLNYSPAELIAMATGRRGAAAYADALKLVEKMGLRKLADAGAAEILEICKGMKPDAVQRLMAGVEIGLRIAELIDHIVVGIDKAISIQEWRSGNRW